MSTEGLGPEKGDNCINFLMYKCVSISYFSKIKIQSEHCFLKILLGFTVMLNSTTIQNVYFFKFNQLVLTTEYVSWNSKNSCKSFQSIVENY